MAVLVVLLGGCGGGSTQQTAGIDGSGARILADGPIEAFGSIVVGGSHYDVSNAVVRINGEIASESDLELGQIVVVQARRDAEDNLKADSIDVESVLIGPVQAVDAAEGAVIVLEQEVRTGPDTVFDLGSGSDLGDLQVGDTIEVNGFSSGEEHILATRIMLTDASAGLWIIGMVDDLNIGSLSFRINDLDVDYSAAGLVEGFPGGGPAEHDRVLVVGDSLDGSGALIATRLELIESNYSEFEGDEAEIEGLITRFVSPTDFDVGGVTATTTSQTDYEGGTEADLQLNVKVQVEGSIGSDGRIVASKIEVKDDGRVY